MTGSRPITSTISSAYPATNVFSFPSGQRMSPRSPTWQSTVKARLEEIVRLHEGWDGYRGRPVSFGNALFALRVLESICSIDAPPPEIVPGCSGDLQIEWHLPGGDIELHVRAPNDVHAWRSMPSDEELILSTDFSAIADWLRDLTEAPLAPDSAAA